MKEALLASLARLVVTRPVSGTKLDIRTGDRTAAFCHVTCRALVLVAGMAGVVTGSQAEDTLAGLTDPTRPSYVGVSGGAKAVRASPMLQSTFISVSQRRAVISGRTYIVGDKFGGGVITEIQPYEVVLKQANRETRLRLLPKLAKETSIVKVPANSQEGGNNK